MFFQLKSSFSRPANTTAYGAADVVADNTTAGDVTPLKFKLPSMSAGRILRAGLYKSDGSDVANASFNLHLFSEAPTLDNGDNGAYGVDDLQNFIGTIAIDLSSGAEAEADAGAKKWADEGNIVFQCHSATNTGKELYGFLEVLGAYTPASAETFEVTLDVEV